MKKLMNKIIVTWLALALIVSSMQLTGASAVEAETVIPDGTYEIDFTYLRSDADQISTAEQYLKTTKQKGTLIVNGDASTFSHTVTATNAAYFPYLGYKLPEAEKAVIVDNVVDAVYFEGYIPFDISNVDTEIDKVTITYDIATERVEEDHDVLMHVYMGTTYDHWYNVRLQLDVTALMDDEEDGQEEEEDEEEDGSTYRKTKEQFEALLATVQEALNDATEGDEYGQYPAGAIQPLTSAATYASLSAAELADDDEEEYGSLYVTLKSAYDKFSAKRKLADTSELRTVLNALHSFLATANKGGAAEGSPGGINAAVVAGEYNHNFIADLTSQVASAQALVDNRATSDATIATQVAHLEGLYAEVLATQYVEVEPLDVYLLDTLDYTTEYSKYNDEIQSVAQIITEKKNSLTYTNFLANVTFNITDIVEDTVRTSNVIFGDEIYIIPEPLSSFNPKAPLVTTLSSDEKKVHQLSYNRVSDDPTGIDDSDSNWKGLGYIFYTRSSDADNTRKVYISYNKKPLEALKQNVVEAQQLLDNAVEVGETAEAALTTLEKVIEEVTLVSSNLAASRPHIRDASAALAEAIAKFKREAIFDEYFTVLHETDNVLSNVNSYVEKPARISDDADGNTVVTMTINDSSAIQQFNVKIDHEYEAVQTVTVDEANNSRVISFTLPSYQKWVDAQLKVVTKADNSTSDDIYNVRIYFSGVNNDALSNKIEEATSLFNAAVIGNAKGQYKESVKNTFGDAITAANDAIASEQTSQLLTDEQLTKLTAAMDTFKAAVNTSNGSGSVTTDRVYPENGHYYIDFMILKNGTTEASIANDYVVSPALVKVHGSTKTIQFTVKQSKEVNKFTMNGQSEKVVSKDTKNNLRVISFTQSALDKNLSGTVRIDWDEFNYHHSYNVEFEFFESSAVAVTETNPSVPGSEDDGHVGPPAQDPIVGDIVEEEADETEAEVTVEEKTQATKEEIEVTLPSFNDIQQHWAKDSINKAIALGIVNGYSDGTFRPNATVNRGEFAVMISRALELESQANTQLEDAAAIPAWAKEHINKVIHKGIMKGFEDNSFRAQLELTRAQLAVIVTRAAGLNVNETQVLSFNDANDIPSWAQKEVAAGVKAGLVEGKEKDSFEPNAIATRAEALTMIIRLLDYIEKQK